jgi:hypothetical protein
MRNLDVIEEIRQGGVMAKLLLDMVHRAGSEEAIHVAKCAYTVPSTVKYLRVYSGPLT